MNPVIENLLTRRSIRGFQNKPVEREKLDTILKCGTYAASAMNRQTWQFTAVTNAEKIKSLAAAMGKALGDENYSLYRPAAIVIVSNVLGAESDNACAMENMMLAAHALGLGSVWINQLKDTHANASVHEQLKALGVPSTHGSFAVCAIGYASADPRPADKKYPVTVVE